MRLRLMQKALQLPFFSCVYVYINPKGFPIPCVSLFLFLLSVFGRNDRYFFSRFIYCCSRRVWPVLKITCHVLYIQEVGAGLSLWVLNLQRALSVSNTFSVLIYYLNLAWKFFLKKVKKEFLKHLQMNASLQFWSRNSATDLYFVTFL